MYRVDNYDGYECERSGHVFGPARSVTGHYTYRRKRQRIERMYEMRLAARLDEARAQGWEVRHLPQTGVYQLLDDDGAVFGWINRWGEFHRAKTIEWRRYGATV